MKNKSFTHKHPQAGMTIYQRLESHGWKKTFAGRRFDFFEKVSPVSKDTFHMTVPHTTRTPIRIRRISGKIKLGG